MNLDTAIPVLVNGKPAASISVLDRGLLYGDGVFETIPVSDGEPRHWPCHMQRLQAGCARLGLPACDAPVLLDEARRLFGSAGTGVLKVIVTRGSAGRGYRAGAGTEPTRILQLHPPPDIPLACAQSGISIRICAMRLGHNPVLAGIKHLNRLEQVMARREWSDAGIMEGLLLDHQDNLIEGTMSNLFLVRDGILTTPVLDRCGVAGITRSRVLHAAEQQGLEQRVRNIHSGELEQADEVFVCNSVIGIWPVVAAGGLAWQKGGITTRIQRQLNGQSDASPGWRER
ncbi:MAG: aminodeoxychorismate lyase [Gammaproteobacteria bacterium]|jgi:4-amino-4-deoxychorismate lyase